MHFKVTARTILQLGSELISSDAIAFYELIKNAFDAGSKTVTVQVVTRLPKELVDETIENLTKVAGKSSNSASVLDKTRTAVLENIDNLAPESETLLRDVKNARDPNELIRLLRAANFITISDLGEGMSSDDLSEIYLTIGTRNRKKQRETTKENSRPVLGEKGLGRLSVMRLGEKLKVETTKGGERNYSVLEIDWTAFSHDSDALLESIEITPYTGRKKGKPSDSGTTITIYDLKSEWTSKKISTIAKDELSKFIDPFGRKNRSFMVIWFNKEPIILESIDKKLFEYAHASGRAELSFSDNDLPVFRGEVHYNTYDRHKTFSLKGTHLASVLGNNNYVRLLQDLGPFSVEIYWYNRRLLTEREGVVDANYIKKLVDTWGGGLMVYRDGFRVNPYGGPSDDWLDIDSVALASQGYKMNRRQIVGKVDLTSIGNPGLLDQTNREGLRYNSEKQALVTLLQYFIWEELRDFLNEIKQIEDENIAALSLSEIEKRVVKGEAKIRHALAHLRKTYPQLKKEEETLSAIESILQESTQLFRRAKDAAGVLEDRLQTTIDLAGLGLMVDVIAHELNRSTAHALQTIASIQGEDLSKGVREVMATLSLQLKTLQTRLKVLDPLGPSGRQRKSLTDIKRLVSETVQAHEAQFKRHNIKCFIKEKHSKHDWKINVVPGMVIQILENLINNSVYWIKQEQNVNKLELGQIEIILDSREEKLFYTDNGPGIPRQKKEDVFRPFFTTKPPSEGKGLGLYISREIAKYHGASLILDSMSQSNSNLHTFVLDFKSK